MSRLNENSSLVALRELREMERRRLHEEAQTRAKAEKERWEREQEEAREREARLAREEAEREAQHARESAESTRLRVELGSAHSEIAHLRGQLLASSVAAAQAASLAPPPVVAQARSRPLGWMVASVGATLLAGTLAISAATRPQDVPAALARSPTKAAPACPKTQASDPSVFRPPATASQEGIANTSPKLGPKLRPSPLRPRPDPKPVTSKICDGTDPLCGIDTNAIDDISRGRRKGDRKPPR